MDVDPLPELTAMQGLVEATNLPEDAKQSALWCLRQLPKLYREFTRTYDSRFVDEILRLTRAALQKVGDSPAAEAVCGQLAGLHERLGLGEFNLKPLPPPTRRPRPGERRAAGSGG